MANYGREIADTIAIGGEKAIQALVAYGSVAVNAIKQYGSDILSGAKSVEEAIANFAEKSYNEVVGGLKAAASTIASWETI